jgi:hypothetical protein
MEIKFGNLSFLVDDENRLFLSKCFFIDNGTRKSALSMTPAYDVAGGSTSGMLNLCSSLATASLRYVSHEIKDNALTVIQQGDAVEFLSTYRRYNDTNAITVTQTVKNTGKEPLCLDLLQSFNLRFGSSVAESHDYLLHRFTNHRYTESLPIVSSLHKLGLCWRNGAFRYLNQGNASSVEYVPEGILENKKTGDVVIAAVVFPNKEECDAHGLHDDETIYEAINHAVHDMNQKLESFKHVGVVELRSEPFEKTPSRKIKRFLVK